MELTQKLKQIFISDLEKYSPYMERDLTKLLMNISIPYLNTKGVEDVVAFCFEYDHEGKRMKLSLRYSSFLQKGMKSTSPQISLL